MRTFARALAISATVVTAGQPIAATAQDAATVVKIDSGAVSGVANGDQMEWLGIPYVAPTLGPRRWKPPLPVKPWNGVRKAAEYGPNCPQPESGFAAPSVQSEDCLMINVWAPKDYKTKRLPVMVSIHGGAYILGSGNMEDTTSFTRDGVIMVSMNYRLGRLGQFAHPALTAENPEGPLGSYTVMDQVAALQWVQRNIAGFGGDPKKVTIFGCSAGGTYINLLMASPKARGLFRGAIAQSDPFNTPWPRLARSGRTIGGSAEELGDRFSTSIGLPNASAAALRAIPVSKLISPAGNNAADRIQPVVDGQYVIQGIDAFEKGAIARVPYITSINSWEGILTQFFDPSGATSVASLGPSRDQVLALYTPEQRATPSTLGSRIMDDMSFRAPQRVAARGSVTAGNPTWGIYFDYVAEAARAQNPMGSAHCSDSSYIYESPRVMLTKVVPTPGDMKVARTMHAYYVNFAKTGNPNGAGLPQWPQYGKTENLLLVDKVGFHPAADPDAARMKVLVPASIAMARGAALAAPQSASAPTTTAPGGAPTLTVDTPIETLAADPKGKAILEKHIPTITTNAMFPQYKAMTLKQLSDMSGGKITPEMLAAVAAELKAIQ